MPIKAPIGHALVPGTEEIFWNCSVPLDDGSGACVVELSQYLPASLLSSLMFMPNIDCGLISR